MQVVLKQEANENFFSLLSSFSKHKEIVKEELPPEVEKLDEILPDWDLNLIP